MTGCCWLVADEGWGATKHMVIAVGWSHDMLETPNKPLLCLARCSVFEGRVRP